MFLKLFLKPWFSLPSYTGHFQKQELPPPLGIHQTLNRSMVNNQCCKASSEMAPPLCHPAYFQATNLQNKNLCWCLASYQLHHAAVIDSKDLIILCTPTDTFPEPVNRQLSQWFCSSFKLNKCGFWPSMFSTKRSY